MGGKAILRAALLACAITAGGALAQDEQFGPRLIEEKIRITAREGHTLAATVLRPEGAGPYGAVILNHGVSGAASERAKESSDLLIDAARVFARRGYVVVMPLRRGFGATGGAMAEDPGTCSNPDYQRAERFAAQDAMAAYEHARRLPYVDANRMILAGQSAGGIVALFAAGTRAPEGLVAVLSFAGGRGGDPSISPGTPCAVEPVARVLEGLGKSVKAPVLFHYAENDLFFGPKVTRSWFERFAAAGAQADYVLQPAFGKDGHYLFGSTLGVRHWLPAVEAFLAKHNVPFERLDAAERAPLLAYDHLPNVKTDGCRNLYRAFLEAGGPRAYAVSADGRCGFAAATAGAREDAMKEALGQCSAVAKSACQLYAVDGGVIWKESLAGQGQ